MKRDDWGWVVASAVVIVLAIVTITIIQSRIEDRNFSKPVPASVTDDQKSDQDLEHIIEAPMQEVELLKHSLASEKPKTPKSTTPPKTKPKALQDKWAGFRGLKWGTNIAKAPGMVLMEDAGDSKFYRREGDKLAIGAAKLERVAYGFYQERFDFVVIEAEGLLNWIPLKDAVFAMYGKGYQPNEFIESWWWGGFLQQVGVGTKDVTMHLKYNDIVEQATLIITYNPIRAERAAHDAKKAKDAAKDF